MLNLMRAPHHIIHYVPFFKFAEMTQAEAK